MITRHIPISGMLIRGEINNMELNFGMSNTKREHIDPENRQWLRSTAQSSPWWPRCFADAGVSVQGSRFPTASQSQLVLEAARKTILVPPPLRSLCLPRLASSGGLSALPIPRCFSRGPRNSVLMPLLWLLLCFSPIWFLISTSISPTLSESSKVSSAYWVFSPHHSLYYIVSYTPTTLLFLPKIGIFPLSEPKEKPGVSHGWYSMNTKVPWALPHQQLACVAHLLCVRPCTLCVWPHNSPQRSSEADTIITLFKNKENEAWWAGHLSTLI